MYAIKIAIQKIAKQSEKKQKAVSKYTWHNAIAYSDIVIGT